MKRISLVFWLTLWLTAPALAVPSFDFSTQEGSPFSWQLANVGGAWQLSFASNTAVVDSSIPADPALQGDYVNLPTMTLGNLSGTVNLSIIPAPGALLLAAIGTLLTGWLRRRRFA